VNRKRVLYLAGFALLLVMAPAGFQISRLAAALPMREGKVDLPGLSAPAEVTFDHLALPTVTAATRNDAYRILGYLHAGERLFQMDLMRRKTAGRLAEILGVKALALDKGQRLYPFESVSRTVVARLPAAHRDILAAYAAGVNAVLQSSAELGLEFRALHYRPEPWRPEDSILVALGLFQTLNGYERDERMLTILAQTLPPEVMAFLTPDTDADAMPLIGGADVRHPPQPVPHQYLTRPATLSLPDGMVQAEPPATGSNNWAVAGSRTRDGRALVANDMHLPLSVPNVWYRAVLQYQNRMLAGVTLPGLPLVVVGSNGHLAWGFTNVDADVLDLVQLETDPAHPEAYRTAEGFEAWTLREEWVRIKDQPPERLLIRDSRWGPVSPEPLQGHSVAIHWTVLAAETINLDMLGLDETTTLAAAVPLFNRAGAPPQNVVLADDRGHIAWTYTGYIPVRTGFDGRVSVSWSDGHTGWRGYIPPTELPRLFDPPEGYLVTANNRTLGKDYPYVVSHAFSHSYRARRIRSVLESQPVVSEADLLKLQLDTVSGFYEYYRTLARQMVRADRPALADALQAIEAWNGRMDADSVGVGLLVTWRQILAEKLFAPLIAPARAAASGFVYAWREQETPLRALIDARITLPGQGDDPARFWGDSLLEAVDRLAKAHPDTTPARLTWAAVNRVEVSHPFSASLPVLAPWLDMDTRSAGGCNTFCVKVLNDRHGASERLVISPNHLEEGLFQMPGGQSGHPLSPHYRDQQTAWLQGTPAAFLPGPPEHHLHFTHDDP
jgi:penicillin amidase